MKILNKIDWILTDGIPSLCIICIFGISFYALCLAAYAIGGIIYISYLKYPKIITIYISIFLFLVSVFVYWHKRNLDWFDGYQK